jgi:HCOMODA/2-hydroxy-3-carboxy-muconic semialdehyde decarboxylase
MGAAVLKGRVSEPSDRRTAGIKGGELMCTASSGAQDGTTISAVVPDAKAELTPPDPALVEELAIANRILFQQGVVDAFGHISVRHDKRPDRYLLARNMAPRLVTPDDIVEFDLDSNPLTANGGAVYLERFIHGEIYRTRPDVIAVVHSHSPAVVPFGIVKSVAFRPVCHMSGFIGEATPIFEIRDVVGDSSDLLVRDHKLGAALAKTLGSGSVVLMRGHGSTAVGNSIRQVVYRAVYTEINARLQSEAMRLGPVTYLTPGEARTADVNVGTQINRAWDFWRMQAEGKI